MGLEQALEASPTGERPRFDLDRGVLVGGRCARCSTAVWPARAVCHHCGGWDVREARLADTARLLTFTDVHVPRPGVEVPYTLGQVAVDESGPLLFGRLRGPVPDETELPWPVRIVVRAVEDGTATYWFEPATGPASREQRA
jgi:uncharacterized OB-fold protein